MNHEARVLIVDDSTENRLLLKVFLKAQPVRVDEAGDGAEAVGQAASTHYDLILMDIQMPVMDGLAATRAIRDRERAGGLASVPILALTADDSAVDRARSLDAGCNEHLRKPITRQSLVEVLQRWLPASGGDGEAT